MIPLSTPAFELKRRTASDVIPAWLIGLLAGLQVVLWLLIIILEAVSVYYSATDGTVYAGFWCSTIFFTTWISMFCFLCCAKANCCGIFLIVINTIALLFSIILVSFTAIFVKNPCECYLPYCDTVSWITCNNIFALRKLPYLKGLLACSILMLVTNFTYVVTYIAISIWLCKRANTDMDNVNAMYQNRSGNIGFTPQQQQQQQQLQQQPLQQQFIPYPMNYPPHMVQQQYAPPPYMINGVYCQPQPQLLPQPPLIHQPTPEKNNADEERL